MTLVGTPDYRSIAADLFAVWDAVLSDNKLTVANDLPFERDKAIRVLALANHVFLASRASLDLLERGPVVVAIPTIRTGYECALTAMWISQSTTDAVRGWLAQDPATRRAMQKFLSAATSPRLRLIGDKVAGTEALGVESNSTLQAEKVAEMLNDFEGGVDMYVFYRYLCGFTHASTVLTDEYMNFDHSPDSVGYEFLTDPKTDLARSTHVQAVVTSMLWALSAVRFIHRDKSVHKDKMRALRSQLQSAAKRLGSPVAQQLTAKANARQEGRLWGTPRPITGKALRIDAKAKGFEYALSPGTGSDNPVHYLWRTGAQPSAPEAFENPQDAAAHIASYLTP